MNHRTILKPLVFALLACVPFVFSYAYGNPPEKEYILYGVTRYLLLYYNPKSITWPSRDVARLQIEVVSKCNDKLDWPVKHHPNCSGLNWDYVITTTEIDCLNKRDRDIRSVGYRDGNPVESSSEETPWSDIDPESYTEFLLKLACH
jgi:hypothetical protein